MKAKGPIHASPGDCVLSCLRRDFHWVTFLGCNKAEESVYKPFWFSYLFVFYKLILLLSGLAPRTGHHFLYLNKTKPPDSYLTEMGENGRPPLKWLEVKRVGNHTHTHTHTHTTYHIYRLVRGTKAIRTSLPSPWHGVGPLIGPFRSHTSSSLFDGLPLYLLPVGLQFFLVFSIIYYGTFSR